MDCVKLYFKDNLVGVLTYNKNEETYMFVKNKFFANEYIKTAIGINDDKEVYYSRHLFSFFLLFLKKYGKENANSEYEELVNIANVNFDKNQFWIGA